MSLVPYGEAFERGTAHHRPVFGQPDTVARYQPTGRMPGQPRRRAGVIGRTVAHEQAKTDQGLAHHHGLPARFRDGRATSAEEQADAGDEAGGTVHRETLSEADLSLVPLAASACPRRGARGVTAPATVHWHTLVERTATQS